MKKLSELTALAAACALTAVTLCSCAAEDNLSSHSDYSKYEYAGDSESEEYYEAEESAGDNSWK